jgi:hypothetical protein
MPPLFGSVDVWALVNGYLLFAASHKNASHKFVHETEPSNGFGTEWQEHSPTGMRSAEIKAEGAFFRTDAGAIHDQLSDPESEPNATAKVICMGVEGQTIGRRFVGFEGAFQVDYEVLANLGELEKANAAYLVSGKLEEGTILHELSAEEDGDDTEDESVDHTGEAYQRVVPITSNSQQNPTVITCPVPHGLTSGDTVLIAGNSGSNAAINGERTVTVISPTTFSIPVNCTTAGGTGGTFVRGKTNGGAAAYFQVEELTDGGFDDVVLSISDSDDDITFAELVSSGPFTAPGAQRVTVAGAVGRYLAAYNTFSGSGTGESVTYFAGLSRL